MKLTLNKPSKDANADVSAKETQVKSAKDAISGTGIAQTER